MTTKQEAYIKELESKLEIDRTKKREYHRKWRAKNKDKWNQYFKDYREVAKKEKTKVAK